MKNNPVKQAIDSNLSHLRWTEQQTIDVMQSAMGGKKMKKKLSATLVLAVVLTVITLSALAAVLFGGKQFVEQDLAPLAQNSDSDKFTAEELDMIVKMAEEKGITIDSTVRRQLESATGTYKEELMRAFVKTELGFYPAQWSIEDQNWYDGLMYTLGLNEWHVRVLPKGDDISQEQALAIAHAYIKDVFGFTEDVTDTTKFDRYLQYMQQFDDNDQPTDVRIWDIEYESTTMDGNCYYLVVLNDGTIQDAREVKSAVNTADVDTWYQQMDDYYSFHYGDRDSWEMETWLAYSAEIQKIMAYGQLTSPTQLAFSKQMYALPDATAMSKEEAFAIAAKAAVDKGLMTQDQVQAGKATIVYLMDGDTAYWKVSVPFVYTDDTPFPVMVELDAHTGEIRTIRQRTLDDRWAIRFVLDELLPPAGPEISHG